MSTDQNLLQEIFDIAVGGVLKQGQLSMNKDYVCLYRGPNNTKCAIGHLIPDEKYNYDIECNKISRLDYKKYLPEKYHNVDIEFLTALQSIHDTSDSIYGFKTEARIIADRYNLKFNF